MLFTRICVVVAVRRKNYKQKTKKKTMRKLYGKTVKSFLKQTLDGREITVAVINSGEWQDVHIIDPLFKKEELNTLYLQEPKDVVIYQKDLWQHLWSHFIWEKCMVLTT